MIRTDLQHRILFSVAEEYFAAARDELHGEFPRAAVERVGPDAGVLTSDAPIATVARVARERPLVFVRHLTEERVRLPRAAPPREVAAALVALLLSAGRQRPVALQAWASVPPSSRARADQLRHVAAEELSAAGFSVSRHGEAEVASICVTSKGCILGLASAADALSDWPGGRVRLARGDGQISRAEFKLEEALQVFHLRLRRGERALDLGASPGGWTRILREHGLEVWAVDPGDLAPQVANDPHVHHVPTTAGRFLASTHERFDVLVNDMRMDPARSARVTADACGRLRRGGLVVMTLKITPRRPLETIADARRKLSARIDVRHIRQLQHNRNEVTLAGYRSSTER